MLAYKNHNEWIIVICDDNETLSQNVASILINRGYTNVFVLSGGLKLVRDKIGCPLITTHQGKNLSPAVTDFLAEKLPSVIIPPLRMEDAASWWVAKTAIKQFQSYSHCRSLDSGLDESLGIKHQNIEERKKQPLEVNSRTYCKSVILMNIF